MYILGYSGLGGYVNYKNRHIYGLTEIERSVGQGMDSAAAIMKDGEIICACEEERLSGKKHTGDFPINAIRQCLKVADIQFDEVDKIVHGFNYEPYKPIYELDGYTLGLYEEILSRKSQITKFYEYFGVDVSDKFSRISHHDSHAACVYYTSGFKDKTLVMVTDGLGEVDSISVYLGERESLTRVSSFGAESSVGMMYAAITEFLGFYPNSDEYKVMGLAAFGDARKYETQMEEIAQISNGEIKINHLFPEQMKTVYDRETYRYFEKYLEKILFKKRKSDGKLADEHMDLAATLQDKTNELIFKLVKYWKKKTGAENLCLSGGVALNCVTNAFVADKNIFKKIYIAPASGDDGTALGACIKKAVGEGYSINKRFHQGMPFYGPKIENTEHIFEGVKKTEYDDKKLIEVVSRDIADGKIVAWARGQMEFGPRALGHRSILADPRFIETKNRINAITKEREMFRPFAPMVKKEVANKYFEINESCNYSNMLVNAKVREEYKDRLQAVMHVDGTSRIQTVSQESLPEIWSLLNAVEKRIGLPILLNTSLNLKGQPIVCFEDDAISTYMNSDIDKLIINNCYVEKI